MTVLGLCLVYSLEEAIGSFRSSNTADCVEGRHGEA